jgi:hypothetical protein
LSAEMLFDGSSPDGDFTFLGTYKKLGEKTALFVHFVCTNDHFTKTGLVKNMGKPKKYRFFAGFNSVPSTGA